MATLLTTDLSVRLPLLSQTMSSITCIVCKVCSQNGCQREYPKTNLL